MWRFSLLFLHFIVRLPYGSASLYPGFFYEIHNHIDTLG